MGKKQVPGLFLHQHIKNWDELKTDRDENGQENPDTNGYDGKTGHTANGHNFAQAHRAAEAVYSIT